MSQLLRPRHLLVSAFFLSLILLGAWVHRDYGLSADEGANRLTGMVNLKYAAEQLAPAWAAQEPAFAATPAIFTHNNRDHGPLLDMLTAVVGRLLAHGNTAAYYYWRHLCIFLFFVMGAWALYRIGLLRFGDWRWALLGSALLVVSPRIFADAFYNSSDIGLLAAFTLGIYTLLRLLRTPTWRTAAVHGLVTAIATDIRVVGLLLGVFTGVMIAVEIAIGGAKNAPQRWKRLRAGTVYLLVAFGCIVLLWPFLWAAPVSNFLYAFERMSRYPWPGSNLYWGRLIPGGELPWHYAPVWIALTTPVPYLLTAALAVGYWAWQVVVVRSHVGNLWAFTGRIDLLLMGWLLGPLILVIVFQSVIYNGWRHLYFIYPALVLLAVRGLQLLVAAYRRGMGWHLAAGLFLLGAGLEIGRTLVRMARMHPHQQVYFSFLPATTAERLFERDYWGLSYRQGLQWLLQHDSRPHLTLHTPAEALLYNNMVLLPVPEQARLRLVEPNEPADYLITNYRLHPQPYPASIGREVHCIYADGIKILSVYQVAN